MKDKHYLIGIILAVLLTTSSCVRPADKNTTAESAKPAIQNSNAQPDTLPLYARETARGDIDRAGLSAANAVGSAQERKWPDTVSHLKQATSHLDKAVSAGRPERERVARMELEVTSTKALIDEAIKSAERGSAETKAQVMRVQAAIAAIKTKIDQ